MKASADVLKEFGVASEAKVISAHPRPRGLEEYISGADKRHAREVVAILFKYPGWDFQVSA